MSVTKKGIGYYYSDNHCTSVDLTTRFKFKLYECFRDELLKTNAYSSYSKANSAAEKVDKIEYIFKNGCYRMGSSSFLINVQSGYVSMSFFANSNQCKDEVDAYYSVKCNTTSVIPYYNKQNMNNAK